MGAQQVGDRAQRRRGARRVVTTGQRQFELQLRPADRRGHSGQRAARNRGGQHRGQRWRQAVNVDGASSRLAAASALRARTSAARSGAEVSMCCSTACTRVPNAVPRGQVVHQRRRVADRAAGAAGSRCSPARRPCRTSSVSLRVPSAASRLSWSAGCRTCAATTSPAPAVERRDRQLPRRRRPAAATAAPPGSAAPPRSPPHRRPAPPSRANLSASSWSCGHSRVSASGCRCPSRRARTAAGAAATAAVFCGWAPTTPRPGSARGSPRRRAAAAPRPLPRRRCAASRWS